MLKKIMFMILLLLPLALALEIPTFEQNKNQTLNVPCHFNGNVCPATTSCNATIINPSGDELYNSESMTKVNSIYALDLNYTDLSSVGQYELTVSCCNGGTCKARDLPFQVTPSGAQPITSGQGGLLLGVMGVIFFISIVFFIWGWKAESVAGKVTGITLGCVFILILTLYSLLILNEAVSGSTNLVSGFETFYTVLKMVGTVGILALIVIVFLVMAKAWKIRRGLVDR